MINRKSKIRNIKNFYISFLAFITLSNAGYSQLPLPDIIEVIKPSIVSILAQDDTVIITSDGNSIPYKSSGSGVIVYIKKNDTYVLTNEHVIAIKDNLENTIRYARNISVSINTKSLGAHSFPAKIRKVDEDHDLAALRVFYPSYLQDSLETKAIPISLWEDETNIREGENILYSGFPLDLGRGERNYPLTRWGIVSQIIPGYSTFLIDAFVQPGYSGSPVFLIRNVENFIPLKWNFRFIGIASSYPGYTIPVFRKVQYKEIPNIKVIDNPGFSRVIGISAIKKLFEIQQ